MDIDLETAHRCVNTNVFGTLNVTRAVAKHMAKRGKGKIVNVGSVVGYTSTPWAGMKLTEYFTIYLFFYLFFFLTPGIYALSKAAVHSMSDTLRIELKPFGIQVVIVAPGAITSNFGNAGAKLVSVPEAKFIIARATASQGPGSTPTDVFATHVTKKVLKPVSPNYITFGATSWIFVVLYYLPSFVKDFFFYKRFGLNHIKTNKQQD
ncbi:hypothetical protein INT48_003088 [Thamnidium elegans]|uniref:Uncharacterized protein n=1 Tax=Thamnidium elegans TaxID=101142 RepID=A0A8H7SSI1_9FUNG|nr:hypothetical protein INT48_003088 [Thamnidium elegans]